MWTYTIGPAAAFLPSRWRAATMGKLEVDWARATAISALVEGFGAAALLVVWYSIFVTRLGSIVGGRVDDYAAGYVGLFSLAMHPLTWVICYFGCEGAVRFLAAVATGESYGTLPLALIAGAVRYAKGGGRGKGVPDEVTPCTGAYDLQIASFHAKEHWKYPLTVRYDEQFYQIVTDEKRAKDLRPHVYFLRRLPANEIIKGLESYDPKSALPEKSPGFFESVAGELRNRRR